MPDTPAQATLTLTAEELELARTALTEMAATHRADMAGTSGSKSTASHGLLQDVEALRDKLLAAQRGIGD